MELLPLRLERLRPTIVTLAWSTGGGGGGDFVVVLRLPRLLRVLKLGRALPQLQVIVSALIKGLSSIGYIAMLLFLIYYLYAIVGMFLFCTPGACNDPWHFGSLHITMFTLFRCSTLEDWTDVMYINMYGCDVYGYKGNYMLERLYAAGRALWLDGRLRLLLSDVRRADQPR